MLEFPPPNLTSTHLVSGVFTLLATPIWRRMVKADYPNFSWKKSLADIKVIISESLSLADFGDNLQPRPSLPSRIAGAFFHVTAYLLFSVASQPHLFMPVVLMAIASPVADWIGASIAQALQPFFENEQLEAWLNAIFSI